MPERRLLIADDDSQTRLALKDAFNRDGFDTLLARDGLEALDLLRGASLNLAILDYNMPGMTGLDILRILRVTGYPCPIIITTSHPSVEIIRISLEQGAYSFFPKPVDLNNLRQLVIRAVRIEPGRPSDSDDSFPFGWGRG
jgi:two-component system, response regulator, stage 0 sporulation protein F